ncbi:MAG TPA: helix-turn-helix domain-containing protein [Mycobacterium sp.]|jgi:DNA-binding MarR family transcriptional regulator|nr:helix-turn-helix domain-containing protein [Mycobacterium sp.]
MRSMETERSAGYLMKRVQQSLRRRCDAALRPTGLSMAQYAALRALADLPDASASELARRCFVTRQSLQDLLTGLRSAGLVTDAPTAPRGRARALALTATGRKRLAAGDAAVDAVDVAMVDGLTQPERNRLAAMLVQCAENLERAP